MDKKKPISKPRENFRKGHPNMPKPPPPPPAPPKKD